MSFSFSHSQEIDGKWHGILNINEKKVPLVLLIEKTDSIYNSTIEFETSGIEADKTIFRHPVFEFSIPNADIKYEGIYKPSDELIEGTFIQNGKNLKLNFSKHNKKSIDVSLKDFQLESNSKDIKTLKLNDTKTYEVTAAILEDNTIISVWMEGRTERKPNSQIGDTRIGYKVSNDEGKTWSQKKVIDNPNSFITGNPYITTEKDNTFLIFMNVKKSFFEGNLAFYEWNAQKQEFQLKSIPARTNNTLLDKPSIVSNGDNVFLTYIEYSKTLEKGEIKYQHSDDKGKSWSKPEKMVKDDIIYLGVASQILDGNIYLSYGTHWQKKIFFKKTEMSNLNDITQIQSKIVAEVTGELGSAMTEMAVSKNGDIAIGWMNIHKPDEVYLSIKPKESKDWNEPLLLSKSGNLLSMAFDNSSNLLSIYSEFKNDTFSVIFKKCPLHNFETITETKYLKKETKIIGQRDYIGAFQKIMYTDKSEIFAFWIDYSKNNELNVSRWKD